MAVRASVSSGDEHRQVQDSGGLMPFTFTFTDKEVSIIEAALEEYLEADGRHSVFSPYDVAELSARITERIAW